MQHAHSSNNLNHVALVYTNDRYLLTPTDTGQSEIPPFRTMSSGVASYALTYFG
ncbi:hypothetical protein AA105894_2355 [Asaia spathodeae NBRC 105894]|nr:hypothetical protein AA105894_2355 [Asaia spathodeae NBRC 105894]